MTTTLRDAARAAPSIDSLKLTFTYDSGQGFLLWNIERANKHVGDRAGSLWKTGYRYVRYKGRVYLEHRLIYAIVFGLWPDQVDHVNMDKSDNRISNLRCASLSENNRNRTRQSNNTSGYKGVTWHKDTKLFHAKIMHNKKRISLGYFKDPADASIAYTNAAKEFHREFARS